jgi:hypothetical protein
MTIAELIERLSQEDPNAQVVILTADGPSTIEDIEYFQSTVFIYTE